jgi:hypothetical protein
LAERSLPGQGGHRVEEAVDGRLREGGREGGRWVGDSMCWPGGGLQ